MFNVLFASSWEGVDRCDPSLARQSETKRMRTMRMRSAGPLISKLRKRELARKRSRVSSMMSAASGSAGVVFSQMDLDYSKSVVCERRTHRWELDRESWS